MHKPVTILTRSLGLCAAIAAYACQKTSTVATTEPPAPLPDLGTPAKKGPGILKYEIQLPEDKPTNHVWIYLPDPLPKTKMPIVLIAPPGSPLFHGISLNPQNEEEQAPYAKAGFAVVAYDLDGDVGFGRPTIDTVVQGASAFKDSQAGLKNEQDALNYALAKVPNVDPDRIYMSGHSSAGAHALLVASQDSRIKGCAVYAPVSDVVDRLGPKIIQDLNNRIPGFADFIRWSSPESHMDTIKCPLLIIHAKDDDVVPVDMSQKFAQEISKTNKNVTLKILPTGGHFQVMGQGIPIGIKWLQSLK